MPVHEIFENRLTAAALIFLSRKTLRAAE